MKEASVLHIGFDDTDSRKGMCTTFLAYQIVDYLKKEKVRFLDYPYQIRFNPNEPWKTRGNGAVALKIKNKKPQLNKKNIVQDIGLETYYLGNGQGLIGAIGAIGYDFRDHTFELISYRDKANLGKKREIFKNSVEKMQQLTFPKTFNSFDESR